MSRYTGWIKVVCASDNTSFPVDPRTLEALACCCYDPDPQLDGAVEMIDFFEWLRRKGAKR